MEYEQVARGHDALGDLHLKAASLHMLLYTCRGPWLSSRRGFRKATFARRQRAEPRAQPENRRARRTDGGG